MGEALRDGWARLPIGCHWTKGNYTISTITQPDRIGYVVVRHPGIVLGSVPTSWDEARELADEDAKL